MNYYTYKAINMNGILVKGSIEGDTIDSVYDDLIAKGLNIIDVKKASNIISKMQHYFKSKTVKRIDVIECVRNLTVMLKAGIPLLSAIEDTIQTTDNRHLKSALIDIKNEVELGTSFSDALEHQKGVFPDIFIRLAKVGETTGRLEQSFSDVADHLQRIEDLTQAIKRALFYPAFAVFTTVGALIFWLVYVFPKIMVVIKEMGVPIPFLTRVLMAVSNTVTNYWYVIIAIIFGLFVAYKAAKSNERMRYFFDMLTIKIPILKLVIYNKLLALFSEQMRILIIAGLTIDRTFDIIASVIGNVVFKNAIIAIKDSVSLGSRISDALKQHAIFPSLIVRMVNIGETSGSLDTQFSFLSTYYIKKLDDVSERLGKIIEPILITIVGLIFILMIMAILLPVYELVSKVGMM